MERHTRIINRIMGTPTYTKITIPQTITHNTDNHTANNAYQMTSKEEWMPHNKQPIRLNGAIYTLCTVLKFIASSVAEAELGALFLNIKEGIVLLLTWRIWDISNRPPPSILTMQQRWASQTRPSRSTAPDRWK